MARGSRMGLLNDARVARAYGGEGAKAAAACG